MGFILKAINKRMRDKKENDFLENEIRIVTDEYCSVEIKLNRLNENIVQLYNAKGKKNKDTRIALQQKILNYLCDIVWVYDQFLAYFELYEKKYKNISSNYKISKLNKVNAEKALHYKKDIRKHFEQTYSSFKSKGKKLEDIDYKKICNKMLNTFELKLPTKEEQFYSY